VKFGPVLTCPASQTDYLLPGAAAYFGFFTEELIPAMEAQYSIDPARRSLVGYSDSGVFVVLARFMENPKHRYFSGVLASDGAFWFDPSGDSALEGQYYAQSHALPARPVGKSP
jgi:predicted alpha/beta superfamily hydrolase